MHGLALFADVGYAAADSCPNAGFRTGPSASLPDCRAYELVTPANKGRTQDLTFNSGGFVTVAGNGEAIALDSEVPFGFSPSVGGARATFVRNPATGWEMKSIVAHGASAHGIEMRLFTPDLSQVAFESYEAGLNLEEKSRTVELEVGPVGGPYAVMADIPREDIESSTPEFLGASEDFSHVLFGTVDHALPLSSAAEETAAKETDNGAPNLYDWSNGHLQLVNLKGGSLVSRCGATLGGGSKSTEFSHSSIHAVSEDGSRIFFTSPDPGRVGCNESSRLFMRTSGGEPVEVSAPAPGVHPSETLPVRYNYATPNGSKVFFDTETALTGETVEEEEKGLQNKLFEYDAEEPADKRLKLIARDVPSQAGEGFSPADQEAMFFSEDGSTVYVEPGPPLGVVREIYRYDTITGERRFVAIAEVASGSSEPSYASPNGDFFLFAGKGVEEPHEPRGVGHNEMYRYDNADGSVMCVTCGTGDAPTEGELVAPNAILETADDVPALTQLTESGQEVFFQTTARLVPQDTNSTSELSGLDVYEWEADGMGGCGLSQGCTHLLSSGEASGPSHLLGASKNGSNVFLATPVRLVPQDTDEFDDIYDARVEGGFAPKGSPPECLSCQGVGSPPPLFNTPASVSFVGSGNPAVKPKPRPKKGPKTKSKSHRRRSKAAGRNGRRTRASKRGKRS